MKLTFALLLFVTVTASIVYTMQPANTASAAISAPAANARVSIARTSEDAREMFSVRIFAPWPDAAHRVIAVSAAGIEADGTVSQSYTFADDTEADLELRAVGPRNRMVVRRNVASWAEVLEASHVTVLVEPNN